MTIQEIKEYLKLNKITYQDLSERSGIALNTLKNIFRGKTEHPRIDTMQAIETALGLTATQEQTLSVEEKQLFSLIAQLTDEEVKELSNFVDYIISKREK
jgi:transcriptional regulator with XRE-family HTH domain